MNETEQIHYNQQRLQGIASQCSNRNPKTKKSSLLQIFSTLYDLTTGLKYTNKINFKLDRYRVHMLWQ